MGNICECGKCNLEVNPGKRFIKGHSGCIMWSKEEKADQLKLARKSEKFVSKLVARNKSEENRNKVSKAQTGEKNHRYGKTETEETKNKKRISLAKNAVERGQKISRAFHKIQKEIREERYRKHSERMLGPNNPMFGISHTEESISKIIESAIRSPSNSSRICGVFDSLRFCSTCELKFLMELEDRRNIIRADGKNSSYLITYIGKDLKKHYYKPDFFDVKRKILIEIKPVGFLLSKSLSYNFEEKRKATIEHCQRLGWTFVVIELKHMNKKKEVFPLRDLGNITLTSKWETQYQKWKENQL